MACFKLTIGQLAELFEPDNIRCGDSIEALLDFGKIEGLAELLHTNCKNGISKDAADHGARIKAYGANQPIVKPPKTLWELILETFQDQMLRILSAAAALSLVLSILMEDGDWLEGACILLAVGIFVMAISGTSYIKEQRLQKLRALGTAKEVQVLRGGELLKLSVCELLVGDVVQISAGQILSVDGILIEGEDISVDESQLTGEVHLLKKKVPVAYDRYEGASPFLISSSKLMSGSGLMLVAAVGSNSYYGKIKLKIYQDRDATALEVKLCELAGEIAKMGTWPAAATFLALFFHYIYDCFTEGSFFENLFSLGSIRRIMGHVVIAASVSVMVVPKVLGQSLAVALGFTGDRMKDESNLLREVSACEAMAGVDNICFHKTGILSQNLMSVTRLFAEEAVHESVTPGMVSEDSSRLLGLAICNNSNASPRLVGRRGERDGSQTECALLEAAFRMGYDYEKWRSKERIKKIFAFRSERKKMATVYEDQNGKLYLFVKGAPDFMLPACSSFVNRHGATSKINQEYLAQLNQAIENFTAGSLTTLFLAYKEVNTIPDDWYSIERDLIILAMVGIQDPLRNGLKQAVQMCHEAGVTVRMVTGDSKKTAIAIAKQAGILEANWQPSQGDYTVMEGREFRSFVGGLVDEGYEESDESVGDMENFKLVRDQLKVLALCSPDDKYLIVTGLKKLDHVVAMVGGRPNEAAALKKADIGLAMGTAGTEIAKEASRIILLDDSFCSIVTAMKWGRNIFDSLRKFVQFQLTVNFVAVVMVLLGGAFLGESPLNPIQMLWVNLIMDTLACLALATEPPSDELLKRKPVCERESQSLITSQMWKFIISQGLMQILILSTILFKSTSNCCSGPEAFWISSSTSMGVNDEAGKRYSIFFNVFVLLQVFNEVNARKLKAEEFNVFKNFFSNKLFLVILVVTIIIQLTMVQYGGHYLQTVELSFEENMFCLLLGSTSILSCMVFKILLPKSLMVCPRGVEFGAFSFYWSKPQEKEE